VLAEGIGMNVLFHDVVTKLQMGNARQVGSLDALLAASDVVTLHVPQTADTRNLMSAERLARMKDGAVLLNASRGNVVDLDALAGELASGRLAGAAIDVFPTEPGSNEDPFESPLRAFDNVILTPHVGGSTQEAQENIAVEVASKLVRYSDNGSTLGSVNFPEVALPEHEGKHRILHVHRNVPGVLGNVNRILYEQGINISAQYLQTDEAIGYVVIDLDPDHSELAREALQDVEHTLRCRVLF
jgi:D-3-phosphoglycerate dehydrogenase